MYRVWPRIVNANGLTESTNVDEQPMNDVRESPITAEGRVRQ